MAANQNLRASDQLSFRVYADYNRHDGYQSHGLDASNRIEGRVSALFTPGSDLTALLFVSGYHVKGAMGDPGIPNVHPLPDDPWPARKSTRLNSSHSCAYRTPSSA